MGTPGPHPADRLRRRYSFGEFTLDLDDGFLRRGGEEVPLRPKPFEVLVYLVERHGRLVTKTELTDAVWADAAVVENSLAQCIVEIRRAVGDEPQKMIRTVARRGYVFAAPVTTPVADFPRLPARDDAEASAQRPGPPARRRAAAFGAIAVSMVVAIAAGLMLARAPRRQQIAYTQLTNFTDSVVSPALSPDGRMLAFIRSESWWQTTDQIFVKLLPDGDPVQVTHDPRPKYGPAFSADGSQITYTVIPWSTYAVSPLGGEPRLLLNNASGATWLDGHHLLFSEVNPPHSMHMGVVTAMDDRSDLRSIYFPEDERGMVHLAYPSPDRKWALVLEMTPVWQPCRVIPLDGSSRGRQVGPMGSCTSAAWSPDGTWMYFGVEVNGSHHLWRERFPRGEPEQITFGPTEEDGIAVLPDGRSVITSIGMEQSAVWIHDARGDRPLSVRGYTAHPTRSALAGTIPIFSRDGASLFYLSSESQDAPVELWKADLASEKSQKALPGISIIEFDISDDAKEVVYSTQPRGEPSQVWVAALDRNSPPRLLLPSNADSPRFGPDDRIVFQSSDGGNHYLERVHHDGSNRSRVVPYPIRSIQFVSPDRRWISTAATMPDGQAGTYAIPIDGGAARRICSGCPVLWAPDGRFMYLALGSASLGSPGKTRVVPLPPGRMLPDLPPSGMRAPDEPTLFPGSYLIGEYEVAPSPDPSVYAYVKTTKHRNLFRIPLH